MLDRRRLITFFVLTALLCQDMAMAIAPVSMFEGKAATKVGKDQSPIPEDVVTEFIKWAQGEGVVISEGEGGLRVLKSLESLELKGFRKDGFTVKAVGDAVTFINNGENRSDAYVLRDSEGNRYVTERFYSYYVNAPPSVKFQEMLHEVFEHEWDRHPGNWDRIFARLEELGEIVDTEIKELYKTIFTMENVEAFSAVWRPA